jgi:hypothetical protein
MRHVRPWHCKFFHFLTKSFYREGLRTLVIAQKLIDEKFYEAWQK